MNATLAPRVRVYLALLALSLLSVGAGFWAMAPFIPYGGLGPAVFGGCALLALIPGLSFVRSRRAFRDLTRATPFSMALGALPTDSQSTYLGHGFEWQIPHSEKLIYAAARGIAPALESANRYGGNWVVHGLGMDDEASLFLPDELLNQHALILGTTGVGKTRMLEVLVAQAIRRGETVIVIDPKGDERLLERVLETSAKAGRLGSFRLFALPYPGKSVRYNPLSHFVQARELADRIAALLPGGGDSEPFRAFCWEVVNTVCQAMYACGEPITPFKIKRYCLDDTWELVKLFLARKYPQLPVGKDPRILAGHYKALKASGAVEGHDALDFLISLAMKDRENYQKMTNTLLPILSKLSTGANKKLMSDTLEGMPSGSGAQKDGYPDMPKEALTWRGADKGRQVVYFFLGSMLGFDTASAVAKMALLDFQSYIGAKYAYERVAGFSPISLFVDELADVVTPEFIGVLNKSRGAAVRITMCGQTSADLEAALRSKAQATQILGNANTVIQFRAQNSQDSELFSKLCGERHMRLLAEGSHYEPALFSSGKHDVEDFRAGFSQNLTWRSEALVPDWAVMELPKFHYFARWGARVFKGRVPLLDNPATDYVGAIKNWRDET
jgi:conjugal transfer pilus assembly protein TraD